MEGVVGAEDVVSVLLSGGWEESSLSGREGEELIMREYGVGIKCGKQSEEGVRGWAGGRCDEWSSMWSFWGSRWWWSMSGGRGGSSGCSDCGGVASFSSI